MFARESMYLRETFKIELVAAGPVSLQSIIDYAKEVMPGVALDDIQVKLNDHQVPGIQISKMELPNEFY